MPEDARFLGFKITAPLVRQRNEPYTKPTRTSRSVIGADALIASERDGRLSSSLIAIYTREAIDVQNIAIVGSTALTVVFYTN